LIDCHILAGADGYDNDLIGFDCVNDPNPISISIQLVIAREVHADLITQVFPDMGVFFKLGKLFGNEELTRSFCLPSNCVKSPFASLVSLTFQVGTAQAFLRKNVVQRVNAGKTLALLNEFVNLHVLGKILKLLPYLGRDNHPLSFVYVFNVYDDFSLLRRMITSNPRSLIDSNP